jgi:hypothetical protein
MDLGLAISSTWDMGRLGSAICEVVAEHGMLVGHCTWDVGRAMRVMQAWRMRKRDE